MSYSKAGGERALSHLRRRTSAGDGAPLPLAEEEIAARLAQHDLEAFEALYDRYGDLVYATALRVVGEPSLAEDVTQEVFLGLWRRPATYAPERGRLLGWLLRVARNRAIDHVRSQSRRLKNEAMPSWSLEEWAGGPSQEDPARRVLQSEERRMVQRALATLPPDQRQTIELAYFQGLTQQEIADLFKQPLGTVKTRIRLGMQKLKALLVDGKGREE